MPLAVVSFALALHLQISPDEVFIEQRLPVGELERVATVGDLVTLVRSWHVVDAPRSRVAQ